MHTPLDEHLHTEECNAVIRKLLECHEGVSKFRQFLGACNDLDMQMRRCTKKERLARNRANFEVAMEKRSTVKAKVNDGRSWEEVLRDRVEKN